MQRSDFFFDLPPELIAQTPLPERSASRLLELRGTDGSIVHRHFTSLPELLHPGDLLVFNDTKVIPARLFGAKSTGGRVEILVERVLGTQRVLAHVRSSKSPKPGATIELSREAGGRGEGRFVRVIERSEELFLLESDEPFADLLTDLGHIPLPPYIERADGHEDRERYQTVYAHREGAVAAPTAGLHFDAALLETLQERGVESSHVTLHVGAGTFQPVRADDIRDHQIHSEWLEVNQATCDAVHAAKERGARVVGVGTTAVRSLETAASKGQIEPYRGDTSLFIYPGYRFNCVDAMITNFHLPESTLLMLVSAFCGRETMLEAYKEAVRERYRFFSYGDAMFLTPAHGATS